MTSKKKSKEELDKERRVARRHVVTEDFKGDCFRMFHCSTVAGVNAEDPLMTASYLISSCNEYLKDPLMQAHTPYFLKYSWSDVQHDLLCLVGHI